MKTLHKFMLTLLLTAGSVFSYGQGIPVRSLDPDELAFSDGERMAFTMHYTFGSVNTDIGTASIALDTLTYMGRKVFHCHVSGRTGKFWDKLFRVREDFHSWFSYDGLRPLRFTRDTYEGKYVAKDRYTYKWNASEPYIDADVYTSSRGSNKYQLPLTQYTYDLPSLFFLARNMDFDKVTPGKKHPMTFAIDEDVYNVHFVMYGREVKKIKGLGKVRTIKFGTQLIAGEIFNGDSDIMIWVTDDENRVPVFFEAPILVGNVSGRLASCEGLRSGSLPLVSK